MIKRIIILFMFTMPVLAQSISIIKIEGGEPSNIDVPYTSNDEDAFQRIYMSLSGFDPDQHYLAYTFNENYNASYTLSYNGYTPTNEIRKWFYNINDNYQPIANIMLGVEDSSISIGILNKSDHTQEDLALLRFKFYGEMTVENNFGGGNLLTKQRYSGSYNTYSSGSKTTAYFLATGPNGNKVYVKAVDQSYGDYEYLWNTTGLEPSKSYWRFIDVQDNRINTLVNTREIAYEMTYQRNSGTLKAIMMKNCLITRDDQTEFDGLYEDQATTYIVEQNSGNVPYPTTKTLNNRTYDFTGWIGTSGTNLIPTDNMTVTARYKLKNNSNTSSAMDFNNQVKSASFSGTSLVKVYNSMNAFWLEHFNGSSWSIAGTSPITTAATKNPSLDTFIDEADYINDQQASANI